MKKVIVFFISALFFLISQVSAEEIGRSRLPQTLERYAIAEYTGGSVVSIRAAWEAMDRDKALLAFVKREYPTYHSRYVIRGLIFRLEDLKQEYAKMLHLTGEVPQDVASLQKELQQRISALKKALDSGESVLNNRQNAINRANQNLEANRVDFENSNSARALKNANKVTYTNSQRARDGANRVTRSNNQIMYEALRRATQGR